MITSTSDIEKIINDYNKGNTITRKNKIFYQNEIGTLKAGIAFLYSKEELNEYVKCSTNIKYFINKYFNIELMKFQESWIDSFESNRFNIHMNSRQIGYQKIMSLVYLHYIIFNTDKNILIVGMNSSQSSEFLSIIFSNYLKLPYFFKPGIITRNLKSIKFDNGCLITIGKSMSRYIDIMVYLDFAHISSNIIDKEYSNNLLSISVDGRIIISSTPNGHNKFIDLVQNSERKLDDPQKNAFKTTRTYWWEVPGRDQVWKQKEIQKVGEDFFKQEYDLQFIKLK